MHFTYRRAIKTDLKQVVLILTKALLFNYGLYCSAIALDSTIDDDIVSIVHFAVNVVVFTYLLFDTQQFPLPTQSHMGTFY